MDFILRQFWQLVWGTVAGLLMGLVFVWVYISHQMPASKTRSVPALAAPPQADAQKEVTQLIAGLSSSFGPK